jgi:23S rRNA pseudouridine2605 synthase
MPSINLNKFVALSLPCTRRVATTHIRGGIIKVNEAVVTDPTVMIQENDVVHYNSKILIIAQELVYFLINKPKDIHTDIKKSDQYIGTLVSKKTALPVFPIDTMSSEDLGLILVTNDETVLQKFKEKIARTSSTIEFKLDKNWEENVKAIPYL